MDWDNGYYVKLYRSQSPDWLALPVLTRGLFAEIMLLADRAGRIPLGKAGLSSLAIPLRADWATVSKHVETLISDGCIVHEPGAMVIPNFVDAQAKAKTGAERTKEWREGKGAKGKGKHEPVTNGDARDDGRHRVTECDDARRSVTTRDGCDDKERKTDQKDKDYPLPPPGAEEVGVTLDPTDHELWQAYSAGVSNATAQLAKFVRHDTDTQALRIVWDSHGATRGMAPVEFLPKLKANATRYVQACQDAKRDPSFEKFYKPEKFLDWLRRDEAGSAPFPYSDGGLSPGRIGTTKLPVASVGGGSQGSEVGGQEYTVPANVLSLARQIGGGR